MRSLKLFGRTFTSIYFTMIVVTAALSVCVWMFSPFIGTDAFRPFDEPFGRWIFIAVLWLICFIILLSVFFVRRSNAKQ
jgi:type VI secretion system protein ImpL